MANKPSRDPRRSLSDVWQTLRSHEQESLKSILDELKEDLNKVQLGGRAEDRQLLEEHATFVREMEHELQETRGGDVGHAVPKLEPGIKHEGANIPKTSKMQIELMVNSFAADFARVATLQFTNSTVGDTRMRRQTGVTEGHHELSQPGQRQEVSGKALIKINQWYCEQMACLVKRLSETPSPAVTACSTTRWWSRTANWEGQLHTLNDIPFDNRQWTRFQDGPFDQG